MVSSTSQLPIFAIAGNGVPVLRLGIRNCKIYLQEEAIGCVHYDELDEVKKQLKAPTLLEWFQHLPWFDTARYGRASME
jgi:hypothetical protein